MSRGGKPTGLQRKLKNVGVAVHNTMEKWESLNAKGSSVISGIANSKLEHLFGGEEQNIDSHSQDASIALVSGQAFAVDANLPGATSTKHLDALDPELEKKCEKLHEICKNMEEVVGKLAAQLKIVQGLQALTQHTGDGDASFDSALTSSQLDDLVETLDSLHAMCGKELSVKQNVAKTVAHAQSRELLMTYCAMWTHQPYLDSKVLDSVLLMTGNKPQS